MLTVRKSADRGHHRESWLSSFHTFSFHTYYDPKHMGFRDLRVINEDRVAGGQGFGMHPHQDMEIISFVLEGALEHRDNLGNREVIGPYELQRITAGTGILHSEVNPRPDEEVHFVQIWLLPEAPGLKPSYEIKSYPKMPANDFTLLTSADGREDSAIIRQDVDLYLGQLSPDHALEYSLKPNRYAWLQILSGTIQCNETTLEEGDGAAVQAGSALRMQGERESEFLLFDLK